MLAQHQHSRALIGTKRGNHAGYLDIQFTAVLFLLDQLACRRRPTGTPQFHGLAQGCDFREQRPFQAGRNFGVRLRKFSFIPLPVLDDAIDDPVELFDDTRIPGIQERNVKGVGLSSADPQVVEFMQNPVAAGNAFLLMGQVAYEFHMDWNQQAGHGNGQHEADEREPRRTDAGIRSGPGQARQRHVRVGAGLPRQFLDARFSHWE